jgi:transcriptional regulator with XRE-family HTH domain
MVDPSPTVRRRRLGLILRGMRERAGLTGEEVGNALERSGSWVSRVETGRVGLRGRDLTDLLGLYHVDDPEAADQLTALAREGKQRGWWSRYADIVPAAYATYIGFESEATELLSYEALCVPGLLQTEGYARAVFCGGLPVPTADAVERKVEVRMARQIVLTKPKPLRLWAIIDESVLHRAIGGTAVMRAQLAHLRDASLRPNIRLQIVPFEAGHHPGMVCTFAVVRFALPDDPDIVYIEGMSRDVFLESEDAREYRAIFEHGIAGALSAQESRERIAEILDESADRRRTPRAFTQRRLAEELPQ